MTGQTIVIDSRPIFPLTPTGAMHGIEIRPGDSHLSEPCPTSEMRHRSLASTHLHRTHRHRIGAVRSPGLKSRATDQAVRLELLVQLF